MSQEVKDFFTTYSDFVTKVTSEPSLDMDALKKSMDEIESSSDVKIPRLLTAALGLGSESGEFVEIVKKMILQGKPASEENIFHMKRELGDIIWYWTTACASPRMTKIRTLGAPTAQKIITANREDSGTQTAIKMQQCTIMATSAPGWITVQASR